MAIVTNRPAPLRTKPITKATTATTDPATNALVIAASRSRSWTLAEKCWIRK